MKEENGVDNQFTINITIGDMDFAIVGSSKLEWAQETKSILMETYTDLFRPTMLLRFVGDSLQQLWVNCNTGQEQWREVPSE